MLSKGMIGKKTSVKNKKIDSELMNKLKGFIIAGAKARKVEKDGFYGSSCGC